MVDHTAQAVLFLIDSAFPKSDIARALAFLRARQLADGSWGESVQQTALAIRALKIGELPNIAVGTEPLSFSPSNPVEGDPVTITARIVGDSAVDVQNLRVRAFDGDPSAGGTPIGQDVVITALPAMSERPVSIAWDTNGRPGLHTIVVVLDPDDHIEEFNETDNLLSVRSPDARHPSNPISRLDHRRSRSTRCGSSRFRSSRRSPSRSATSARPRSHRPA